MDGKTVYSNRKPQPCIGIDLCFLMHEAGGGPGRSAAPESPAEGFPGTPALHGAACNSSSLVNGR